MEHDPALQTYVAECRELLQEMEDILLRIEQEEARSESLNAIFRAAHTIKGSAGLFGLDGIVEFTHVAESLLDGMREGNVSLSADIVALLLEVRDHITLLVNKVERGDEEVDAELSSQAAGLVKRLVKHGAKAKEGDNHAIQKMPESPVERIEGDFVSSDNWHISLRFGENSLRDGMDPMSFLRYLGTMGTLIHVVTLDDKLPALDGMEPESCYLGFEINFNSDADKQTIDSAFEFIREDSKIRILPPHSLISEYVALINGMPEEDMRLGEMLVQCGTLTQPELELALSIQEEQRKEGESKPIGDIMVEEGMMHRPVLNAAVEKQAKVRETKVQESRSVRVDADKLDHLINLIGELVITGAGATLNAKRSGDSATVELASRLERLVEDVRDSALQLRMVQIGATFNRFQRVVRDVSKELGKEIQLVINGADTELDKTVVEKIADPLMHLVRNSMDHGIEEPDVRLTADKPRHGTLSLNAYHDSGSIMIEISDDGKGLNREKIVQKAIAAGLIDEAAQLSDHEIDNLIFEPGLSTADQVSNLSGRGVGMDVVRRNIVALRGNIEVESRPGIGTTTRVRLPLTLAIIDGFLVEVERCSFVLPLDMVLECVEITDEDREKNGDHHYVNLRGEVLPIIRLRDMFSMGGQAPRRENVVVVHYGGRKAGLVVDKLNGESQTVIKSLGKIFSHLRGISGSTIMGNGEVALILDVPGLVRQVSMIDSKVMEPAA